STSEGTAVPASFSLFERLRLGRQAFRDHAFGLELDEHLLRLLAPWAQIGLEDGDAEFLLRLGLLVGEAALGLGGVGLAADLRRLVQPLALLRREALV